MRVVRGGCMHGVQPTNAQAQLIERAPKGVGELVDLRSQGNERMHERERGRNLFVFLFVPACAKR